MVQVLSYRQCNPDASNVDGAGCTDGESGAVGAAG